MNDGSFAAFERAGEKASSARKIHPWEDAGLGLAPFRCLGVERRIGPIKYQDPKYPGITTEIGSPGQPMGTCDFCGQGIADCYIIVSKDGKKFVVGSDCVRRTYQEAETELPATVRKAIADNAREKREAKAQAKRDKLRAIMERLREQAKAALAADPALFTTEAHPAIPSKTLRDYYEWMLFYAGDERRIYISKQIIAGAAK
jgi:hypothetical protein